MDIYAEISTAKEWEGFCARMLRFHYGADNFWLVPDEDQGDLGLEFFTIDGTIFQCYFPEKNADMPAYKTKVQKKINDDLKKLKKNETEIEDVLHGVVIKVRRWILLIPVMKSRKLITYCNRKRTEHLKNPPSFIDTKHFQVKIETAESYPNGAFLARQLLSKAVDIPVAEVTESDQEIWKVGNTEFSGNIDRKSNKFMPENSIRFKGRVVEKYIQIDKFLEDLRENYPDIHLLIEDGARAQLERIKDGSLFEDALDKQFVKDVVRGNKQAFSKHDVFMSESNVGLLSIGYLSKWLAECYMDFSDD